MPKKVGLFYVIISILLSGFLFPVQAEEDLRIQPGQEQEELTLYFFEDRYCGVCRAQKDFMDEVIGDYPHITIETHPVTDREKLNEIGQMHGVENPEMVAPTTFIGENYFRFYDFGEDEKEKLLKAMAGEVVEEEYRYFRIPFLETRVDVRDWSLPLITVLLGTFDGFNVCSLAALVLILSIVLSFNSRRKIAFYGGLFILVSVTVYGVLVFAWRGLLEVLAPHSTILGSFIGVAAILGGLYFLKEFFRYLRYGPSCESSQSKIAQKATEKLQQAFADPKKGALALTGSVILFAVIITFVELPCSIGLPIIFAGILADAGVSLTVSVLYIILYLSFYMLIEIIIFTVVVVTRELWIMNTTVVTAITFIASMVLFALGAHYLLA